MDLRLFLNLPAADRDALLALHTQQQKIARTRDQIKAKRKHADDLEKAIQEECTHPMVVKTHRASTGNYDPSADCYWTDMHCPDCDKHWSEEGSK